MLKLCVKKIYCPKCKRLVTCKEQKANEITSISCSRCGTIIWNKSLVWKYAKQTD